MTTPTVPHSRNWGIDCLRGLSILLVVLNHLALGFRLPLRKTLLAEFVPPGVLRAISFNGYEAVFIFFVISGYLICTRVLAQYGALNALNWRDFYRRRASRILPLLLILIIVLSIFHGLGVKDYVIDKPGQSLAGSVAATLGLYLNWYEGQTTWLPAPWDVLWSLSIEEAFYLGFPVVCLWLPRRVLIFALVMLAISLPFTKAMLDGNDIWQEKAYLPGMAAIALGVLCAIATKATPHLERRFAVALLCLGMVGLFLVFFCGKLLWQAIGHGNMLVLTLSAGQIVVACRYLCQREIAPTGLQWLASMGRLSYEIYLTHMFVVLTVVALYRQYVPSLAWAFVVYPFCIFLTVLLGWVVRRWVTNPLERKLRYGMVAQV